MAYVQPTGTIQLFRGVNLDNRYMHTLYFGTTAAQTTFFDNFADKVSFTNQYFSRPHRNVVRVKANCEDINNVTYMRFQNYRGSGSTVPEEYPRSASKWYYAFVTSVNYVNENVTDVTYEIDVMQTWFFQTGHHINPCYVEREHVAEADDIFGHFLEPEPCGSEIMDLDSLTDCTSEGVPVDNLTTHFENYHLVLNTSAEPDVDYMIRDGIVNGTDVVIINPQESLVNLKETMESMLGSWDQNERKAEIVDMYMFPGYFAGKIKDGPNQVSEEGHKNATYFIKHPKKYNNYVPENLKLFTYPFSYLYCTTKDGDAAQYRWEYFDQDLIGSSAQPIQFDLNSCVSGGGTIEIHPSIYNGIQDNYDAKLTITNFPKCAWAYDAYEAFIAAGNQTKLEYESQITEAKGLNSKRQVRIAGAQQVGNAAVSGIDAFYNKNTAGMAHSVINASAATAQMVLQDQAIEYQLDEARHKIAFEFADAQYQPNTVVGKQVPNIAVGSHFLGFHFYHAHIRDDEMIPVDNFLTMYGYSINTVKVPNLTGRPYWNFVKTKDAQITGKMPASSKEAIARIFNGGIFLWNQANGNDNIGNFRQKVISHNPAPVFPHISNKS